MAASRSSRMLARAARMMDMSVDETLEQDGGEVALAEARDDDDDGLAGVLGPGGHLVGGGERGAGGDAHEQALLDGGTAGPLHRGLGIDVDHLVVDGRVEDLGNEVGADALDLVRAGGAAVEDRGLLGLDGDDLHAGFAGLEHLADTGDGATGADAGDDDVDLAVGVLPDLLGGGPAVDLRVRDVGELAGQHGTLALGDDLLGLGDGALHPEGGVGEDQLSTVGAQQCAPLLAHRLRHREHHGQGDAGVARGGLDDRAAGLQVTGGLRRVDDRDTDAVLHRARRAVELELGGNDGVPVDDPVEPDERGVADGLGHVVEDGHLGAFRWNGRRPRTLLGTRHPARWSRRRCQPSSAYAYSNRELSPGTTTSCTGAPAQRSSRSRCTALSGRLRARSSAAAASSVRSSRRNSAARVACQSGYSRSPSIASTRSSPCCGPRASATATAWLSRTTGPSSTRSSTSYHDSMAAQSVSSHA